MRVVAPGAWCASPPLPQTMLEFEAAASCKLSEMAKTYFGYVQGEGATYASQRGAWEGIRLVPRIMRNVETVDVSCEVFGQRLSMPVVVAPTAFHKMAHDDGELATARGARKICYTYNHTYADVPIEDVSGVGGAKWLHMYFYTDREVMGRVLEAALESGAFSAVLLTCDHPHQRIATHLLPRFQRCYERGAKEALGGRRFSTNLINAGIQDDTTWADLLEKGVQVPTTFSASVDFEAIRWVKTHSKGLPVVCKGILHPDDARKCVEHGADAIVVSNHSGRQCDFAPPAIEILPSVVAAVAGRCDVWVDSGVRSSSDVLKALCLGAKGVLIGRPVIWAIACDGAVGLERADGRERRQQPLR